MLGFRLDSSEFFLCCQPHPASLVIPIHCRKTWLSALMRALRNEVIPVWMRKALIVVDRSCS
jgi:hypothetical protein